MKVLESGEVDIEDSVIMSYVFSEIDDGCIRADVQAYFKMDPFEGEDSISCFVKEFESLDEAKTDFYELVNVAIVIVAEGNGAKYS